MWEYESRCEYVRVCEGVIGWLCVSASVSVDGVLNVSLY